MADQTGAFCESCGKKIDTQSARFCRHCGAALVKHSPTTSEPDTAPVVSAADPPVAVAPAPTETPPTTTARQDSAGTTRGHKRLAVIGIMFALTVNDIMGNKNNVWGIDLFLFSCAAFALAAWPPAVRFGGLNIDTLAWWRSLSTNRRWAVAVVSGTVVYYVVAGGTTSTSSKATLPPQAAAVVTSSAPSTTRPSPSPTPEQPHVGSVIEAGNWRYSVRQVDVKKSVTTGSGFLATTYTAKGNFVIVLIQLTNIGKQNFSIHSTDFELRDDKGIRYNPESVYALTQIFH